MKDEIIYIWFQQAVGIYSRLAREIYSRFDSISDIYNCSDFSFLGEKRSKYIKKLESKDTSAAFEIMKKCEALGVRVTGYYDELYPEKLRAIDAAPAVLYSIGDFKDLNRMPCVAIVGTRKMSDNGKALTERFAYTIAKSGGCIVSGLAKGIDTAAHRGAVMAGGYTVAVLGNPIGDVYPKENLKAFETLYKRGLVISELYPGAPRTKADFPNRNRIISGISDAVVITEAGEGSGALITAKHAVAQNKMLFAVPGAPDENHAGTNALIKRGVTAVTEPNEVLSPLSLANPEALSRYMPEDTAALRSYGNASAAEAIERIPLESADEIKPSEEMKPIEPEKVSEEALSERILAVLKGPKPITADEIAAKTGIPISDIMVELTLMEIDGSIICSVGGRYISSKF